MRILLAIDDASLGGGQMHVLLLAKYLPHDIFEVEIATEATGWLVDEARKLDLKIHSIAISNRITQQAFNEVRQLLIDRQFALVHTHGGTAGFWLRSIALTLPNRPRLVHTYHGLHYLNLVERGRKAIRQQFKQIIFQTIDRYLSTHTNWIICVCQADLNRAFLARIANTLSSSIVNNGIEIDRFSNLPSQFQLRKQFAIEPTEFIFGNVGRLHAQKGHKFLLHAFVRLADKARLFIIGDGDLRTELMSLAEELKIADRVVWLGARADIREFLAAIDVFVLPSLWEGQPIVLLEALATGKYCIATNVDGIPEIISHDVNGFLVPPRDVDSLAVAMNFTLARLDCLKSSNRARSNKLLPQFSAEYMSVETAKIYRLAFDRIHSNNVRF